MVLSQAEMLSYLNRLRQIKKAGGFIDTSRVEDDFLNLSSSTHNGELTVAIPRTYRLENEDSSKLEKALEAMLIDTKMPSEIGISGGFNGISNNLLFLVSLNQLNTDYNSHNRAYLNPLLEKVYGDGAKLIRDFTVHEAIFGKVKCLAGELDLNEIGLFPEKFKPGAYTLSVELDTPQKTIRSFMEYAQLDEEFKQKPEESMKDETKITELSEKALKLRAKLGALSRYETPKTRAFYAQTNSCMIEDEKNTYFYLYNPEQKKNVLVHFGKVPFSSKPLDLEVLDGAEQQSTLASLVEMNFYKVSANILGQRIKDISQLYEGAARATGKNLHENYTDFEKLLERLKINQRMIEGMASEESKKRFALEQPVEILEFMVCPNSLNPENPEIIDPVVHDLLAHLSWNSNLRNYHDSTGFIRKFQDSSDEEKEKMLIRLSSGLSFANQQNNDVNIWLYNQYQDFCKSKGIKFKLVD